MCDFHIGIAYCDLSIEICSNGKVSYKKEIIMIFNPTINRLIMITSSPLNNKIQPDEKLNLNRFVDNL